MSTLTVAHLNGILCELQRNRTQELHLRRERGDEERKGPNRSKSQRFSQAEKGMGPTQRTGNIRISISGGIILGFPAHP